MDCMNCTASIPPQWVACIQENKCPSCGKQIMDEKSQELLAELREAMAKMPNDPEALAGWLLSNYRLHKIGTAEPTKFYKPRQERQEPDVPIKVANNPVHSFLKRAGYNPQKNQRKFKELVDEINGSVGEADPYDPHEEIIEAEEGPYENDEFDIVQPTQYGKQSMMNNSIVVKTDGLAPLSQQELAQIEAFARSQKGAPSVMPEEPAYQALEIDRINRLRKQQAIASGGIGFGQGKGAIRRAG